MQIVFDPSHSKNNKYVEIITDGLADKGYEVFSVKQIFSDFRKFRKVRIVHLNWYENLDNFNDFLKKSLKLLILIIAGKKIIWTMHNKFPHGNDAVFFKKILLKWIVSASTVVIIHSKISKEILLAHNKKLENKIVYIPHPNYIDKYGDLDFLQKKNASGILDLLFIGAIKPYKNIELLIDIIKELQIKDVNLAIAGNAINEHYKRSIFERAGKIKNVNLHLSFVEDASMVNFLSNCDLLVLPYDVTSSLNSGTILLAFSYAKTVICPNIGTVLDYDMNDSILTYDYSIPEEHKLQLMRKIEFAIDMKKNNDSIFEILGRRMYDVVAVNNNNELIISQYDKVYKRCLPRYKPSA